MIPKNKRRTIIVNGQEWEYCISGFVSVFIKNQATKQIIEWWQDWKEKWKQAITPKDIRELIETKKLYGDDARVRKG